MVHEEKEKDPNFDVSGVLAKLQVSRSGYYAWLHRIKSRQQIRKEEVQQRIVEIYNENHKIYGAPKITVLLNREGCQISQRTVSVYMKEIGIKAIWIKPWTRTTLNSDFSTKLENILKREFNPTEPNAVWCTDITYIWTLSDGFVYLTSVMNLYSRKIIAWVLTKTMEAEEVLRCIRIAIQRRKTDKPVVVHSDRGSQYVSRLYRILMKNMRCSYSAKGTPWDNACIESFHSIIKREWLDRKVIFDYDHAYELCFEYIETFYNTVRIHSHCGYESPNEYEKNWESDKY